MPKKGRQDFRECEVYGCDKRDHVYGFPKDNDLRLKWKRFVNKTRKDFDPDTKSCVCYRDFADDCFSNLGQFTSGFAGFPKRVSLNIVPTIYPATETPLATTESGATNEPMNQ